MDSITDIKACKLMLVESAKEINLDVVLKTNEKYTSILFYDNKGLPVYNAYNDISTAIGFIHGIKSKYKFNQQQN